MVDDYLGPLVAEYAALAAGALSPAPGRLIVIQPGAEVAWDQCDCDGQAWARIITVTTPEMRVKASGLPCGVSWWNVLMAVGVLRCVSPMADDGEPPSAAAVSADGGRFTADLSNLLQAVGCAPRTQSIVEGVPLGPQGGCAGSEVRFMVRVPVCGC